MIFEIIPTAEASVVTLVKSINKVIINPLIFFIFALALVYFIYGLAQYLLSPENEEIRKSSKSHMIWAVAGMFIMVSVFGIMNLILNTVGVPTSQINIQNNGDYTIGEMQ
jgi:cell division septal protein FtsQ